MVISPLHSMLSQRNPTLYTFSQDPVTTSEANLEPQPNLPRVQVTPPFISYYNPVQSTISEVSPTASEQQTQQDQQQEAQPISQPAYIVGATQTQPNPHTFEQLFAHSPHSQTSVLAAARTMDRATQTQTPNPTTAATAGSAPAPILPAPLLQQPASSAGSGTNPTISRAPSTIASLPQQPAGPPITPYPHPPYQPPHLGLSALPTMAQ